MSKLKTPIIVGTRGSELALVQAASTEAALAAAFPDREIIRKVITTTGDRRTDVPLSEVAKSEGTFDKGVFIKEIEEALAAGEIDIAVHSLKDLPTKLEPCFTLAAVLERAPIRDVLIVRRNNAHTYLAENLADHLNALPANSKVGTGSVRRAKQVEWLRSDIVVTDLRGNVPTRLRKLAETDTYDAIILAEAGLVRLGHITAGDAIEEIAGMPWESIRPSVAMLFLSKHAFFQMPVATQNLAKPMAPTPSNSHTNSSNLSHEQVRNLLSRRRRTRRLRPRHTACQGMHRTRRCTCLRCP